MYRQLKKQIVKKTDTLKKIQGKKVQIVENIEIMEKKQIVEKIDSEKKYRWKKYRDGRKKID